MQSDATARARKKIKLNDATTSGFPARKTGLLSKLTDMPIDILFEIFGSLNPYDVLRLARVTKSFRRLLLHKSASGVWRAARENLTPSMPDRSPGMSEPAWIHLVFDTQCYFCSTKGLRVVDWRLRVRICSKCIKTHTKLSAPMPEGGSNDIEFLIQSMVPQSGKKKSIYLTRDYQAIATKYHALKTPEARNVFFAEQREIIDEIEIHAQRCEEWANLKASDRTQEIQDMRKDRQAAIIERLIGLGYKDDIERMEYPHDLKHHVEFTRAQRLTERVWKNIQATLVAVVEQSRQKRLARLGFSERSKPIVRLFQQYKNSHLPYAEIMPGPIELCRLKKVKVILDSPPVDGKIDETTFSAVVPLFNDFVNRWRKYIHLRLLHHVSRAEDKEERMSFLVGYDVEDKKNTFDPKPLRQFQDTIPAILRPIVFVCDNCTPPEWDSIGADPLYFDRAVAEPLYYPEVLDHHCLTRDLSHHDRTQSTDSLKHLEHYDRDRQSWNCRILSVEKSLGRIFAAIIELAGGTSTMGALDMDQLDKWFACMKPTCLRGRGYNPSDHWAQACNWRNAVKHHAEHHPDEEVDFATMTSFEVDFCRSRLVPLEEQVVLRKDWLCAHCRDLPGEHPAAVIDAVKEHLKTQHNIADAQLNRDYYKRFGAPLPPVFGKGPLGTSLEIFGDIPLLKVGIVTD
ncbi:hypothetical protein C8R47DRAFT_196517 [Mycena vitilis]|nr:hypothetical protein C8R47DRAFT_196517 [Mycena vitilis]